MNYYLFLFFGFVSLSYAQDAYPYIVPVSVEKASEQHKSEALQTQEEQTQEEQTQPSELLVVAPLQTKDSDADGITDDIDQCAETPKYFRVDGAGCPQQAVLPVHFASDSVALTTAHIQGVKEFAEFVKQHKEYQIIIYNYTDNQGDASANRALSQKRANAIKEALMHNGVSSTKLTAIGRGDENPRAENTTPEGRKENNRTEVEIIL